MMRQNTKGKTYYFPCGAEITLNCDTGFAYGVLISQKKGDADESTRLWSNNACKKCQLNCRKYSIKPYTNTKTHETYICNDIHCIAYSRKYLDNKDKPTLDYLSEVDRGTCLIELILQSEDYRAVLYWKQKNFNCSLLSFIDETYLEEQFQNFYNRKEKIYTIYMTSMETGETLPLEFESIDEVVHCIASARFVKFNEGTDS